MVQIGDGNRQLVPKGEVVLDSDTFQEARVATSFTVERERRATYVETVTPKVEGPLLIGELPDVLLILPLQDLSNTTDYGAFQTALISHAKQKPFIIIELNQQTALPTDSVVYPLLNFIDACEGKSQIFVATRSDSFRERANMMRLTNKWTTVDSGKEALQEVDLQLFLAERKARKS